MVDERQPTAATGSAANALASGATVGSYEIVKVLGAGGFGITYLVRHCTLNKRFALKEYFPSSYCFRSGMLVEASQWTQSTFEWGLDSFVKEAKTLARFEHPAIVKVFDIFEGNGTAYIVLEFEEGQSLRSWARANRSFTQSDIQALALPLIDAVKHLHRDGLLHRDIAPDNIIVRPDNTAVLIDFGSARPTATGHRVTSVVKPGYSPIEQYQPDGGQQGPWSDIYSLGATLYFLVSGRELDEPQLRQDGEQHALRYARPGYTKELLEAIDWALQLRPEQRPKDLETWSAALFKSSRTELVVNQLPVRRSALPVVGLFLAVGIAAIIGGAYQFACSPSGWLCMKGKAAGPEALTPLGLELALAKTSFKIGDDLKFSLRADRDCYFLVYTIGPNGSVEQHMPTEKSVYMGPPVLKAGEWRDIPTHGTARIKAPTGQFQLGALCSSKPLASIGLTSEELAASAKVGRRSFEFRLDEAARVRPSDEFTKRQLSYEVVP